MEGQGNIIYGSTGGAGGGGIVVAGARNGLSVDSAGFVVLGNDVGGSAAALTNNRAIPMAGFVANFFDGNVIISDFATGSGGQRLQVHDTLLGTMNNQPSASIDVDYSSLSAGSINNSALTIDVTPTGDQAIDVGQSVLALTVDGEPALTVRATGLIIFGDPTNGGNPYAQLNPLALDPTGEFLSSSPTFTISQTYDPTLSIGLANAISIRDIFVSSGFGGSTYTGMDIATSINQTGAGGGDVIGIDVNWSVTALLGQLISFRNAIGDCLFQSNAAGGRSGFQGVVAPSAWVHIGAGAAAAESAPLKLTPGTNLTTPESGAFEFDGTNLFFTVGGTRKTVTLI